MSPISDRQATLAVIQRLRSEVHKKQQRVSAFTAAGETPPKHLVEDLRTDENFLAYLGTMTTP